MRKLASYGRKNQRRRSEIVVSEHYTLAEIAARDGYRCGLCHRKVNMALSGLHPRGPTIDHIAPLSLSKDDRRVNVQLAHRICNLRKKDHVQEVQLLLIG